MGHKVGQVALRFGANDYGSLMMEENVVSAAGTTYRTTLGEIDRLIRDAGYRPMRRRQDYSVIEEPVARDPGGDRLRLPPLRRGPSARPRRRHHPPS